MIEYKPHVSNAWEPEPRWPALIAILAVGLLYTALPRYLIVGPRWLFLVILVVLMVPTIVTHFRGHHLLNRAFGFSVIAVLTLALIASVLLLVRALPEHLQSPTELLLSAVSLWLTNIFVFALWYWRLDAGGPHGRDQRPGHSDGAFLFPQMTNQWSPNFVDYSTMFFRINYFSFSSSNG
jgi:hypothetical protein